MWKWNLHDVTRRNEFSRRTDDSLVRRHFHIVRESEPVIATVINVGIGNLSSFKHHLRFIFVLKRSVRMIKKSVA